MLILLLISELGYVYKAGDWYVAATLEIPIQDRTMPLVDTVFVTVTDTIYKNIDNIKIFYFEPGDTVLHPLIFSEDAFISADPTGNRQSNEKLLQQRAESVRKEFSVRGVLTDSMFVGRIAIIKVKKGGGYASENR